MFKFQDTEGIEIKKFRFEISFNSRNIMYPFGTIIGVFYEMPTYDDLLDEIINSPETQGITRGQIFNITHKKVD